MSLRLTPISQRDLIKRLRKNGWSGPETGTHHPFMRKGQRTLRIPNPGEVRVDILRDLLNRADISRKEWLSQ